ncbi:NAD-dependent epimerase/dehydratase family protein [Marinibaculum pumilum]|uniref:NAD-dependent epimerase/dehydratase family protein n=1 Tax=Marinibaculum pumilum TaxID=1766165 RepID=A0ABV7L4U8_9PROT
MLQHQQKSPALPERTVILGAGGFVGAATAAALKAAGGEVLALGRGQVDLLADDAADRLAAQLKPGDAVMFVSAKAPVKDNAMLLDNIRMGDAVCRALAASPVAHLLYVSSDAVYADTPVPLTEASAAAPGSLHGAMHVAREVMLRSNLPQTPLCCLRPTLIYGASDPHNGYGPNRFRRLANEGSPIRLFGEGEELRDHVLVDDVAELARLILCHRSTGILNAASGTVTSFRRLAELAVAAAGREVAIEGSPRSGPMPHNGYRPFDITAIQQAFPTFRPTPIEDGIALAQKTAAAAA